MNRLLKRVIVALFVVGSAMILWTFLPQGVETGDKVEPKRGGVYRIPTKREIITLDPRKVVWIHEKIAMQLVFDPLIRLTAQYQLEPALCREWEMSSDSKKFTCQLRQNVFFHDGRIMNVDDVLASLHYVLAKGGMDLDEYEDIAGIDDYWSGKKLAIEGISFDAGDLIIKFNKPVPMFAYHLATTRIVIMPGYAIHGDIANFFRQPIGTGPFKYETNEQGRWVFSRNDKYYDGVPYLDRIELMPMSWAEAIDSLKDGGVNDMRFFELTSNMASVIHSDDIKAIASKSKANMVLFPNNSKPPFDNKRMRELLFALIDKADTLSKCGERDGYTDSIIPSGVTGYVYRDMGSKYNYRYALEMLSNLRKDGNDIPRATLYYSPDEAKECIVRTVNDNFLRADVPWRFVSVSPKKLAELYFNNSVNAHIETLEVKNADAFTLLKYFMSTNKENLPRIDDQRIDSLLRQAGVTGDPQKRSDIYRSVNGIICEGAYALPLLETRNVILYSDDVRIEADSLDERNFIQYAKVWLQR